MTNQSRADALTEAERLLLARVNDCTKPIDAADRNGILKLIDRLAASPVEQPAAAPIDTPTDREFALSAAICVHPKGVYGDEGGSMCCPITHTRDASFAPSPADERAARLDDADIDTIAESMPGGLDSFIKQWGWRQFARAVEDEVILNVARAASANETGAEGAEPMAVPAGWKLVPVAPTFEMCRAMEEAIDAGWKDSIVWARGIAAAPQHPAQADAREPKIDAQPEGGEIAESLVPQGEVARSGGAREGLTDAIEQLNGLLDACENGSKAERVEARSAIHAFYRRALLAAHPGHPEPCAEVTDTVRVPARVLDLLNIINRDGVLKRAAELQEVYRLTGAVRVGEAS
ncbi:hypothetical protein [Burkholderia multivorans]|uniref:hypothetical protein n=1 Tax=Burkholderia multivorans TaxID=87883 RepID=UPI001FC81E32|nr:hypothetical protein [Burkholderia multivorans]MDR9240765.1 hypothetical protein [Burkholderia multivorans]MDR9266444.1 hypothetical protein [Burkholderia multivorans]MDR9287337.1 hypothetical protein [Burkholderia multivorans]MDR9289961.1 hypothetical protein [Burkholderia multivorans]MDR9312662.1 hypothetical protein [Burkholderia multivorans]